MGLERERKQKQKQKQVLAWPALRVVALLMRLLEWRVACWRMKPQWKPQLPALLLKHPQWRWIDQHCSHRRCAARAMRQAQQPV